MPAPLGITCGDISGIGPELIDQIWAQRQALGLADFNVIGPRSAFKSDFGTQLIDLPLPAQITLGKPDRNSAAISRDALELAAKLAFSGDLSAVVTAPVHKASLYSIGFDFPGQTEFFAARCGIAPEATVMMMAGPDLRTVPLTIHIPLNHVFQKLTRALIVQQAAIVHAALQRDFAIAAPRLALAGLNPHAGEAGHLGREEIDVLQPALENIRAQGINIAGPLPADSLFAPSSRRSYDAILCAYHDQALIPVKTLDPDRTVNVTLGLPIIRTSPDHGTGHDIAGKGIARADSLIEAVRLAQTMVQNRG